MCLYCDHKPMFYLRGRKGQLSHRFLRYQVIITKTQNLKIIWTPGSNLNFPVIVSQNVKVEDYQNYQLQHKEVLRIREFYDEHGSPITYRFQHDDNPNDICNDFYPIHCRQGNDKKFSNCTMMVKNSHSTLSVTSFLQQRYNPQPIFSDWAEQSINSDAYAYPQRNP